jgi:anti-sigma regulatory factor (Ser/Thr protein kinase)
MPPFHHEALLYEGPDAFVDAVVPFIVEGVDAGEPVMVAVSQDKITRLHAALGKRADDVRFEDMGELGLNPARIIPAWHDFVEQANGPVRGVGEPISGSHSGAPLVECQLHESLLNIAFDRAEGFRLACPYDTAGLDPSVIHEARCSHPHVGDGHASEPSRDYRGLPHMLDPFDAPLPAPPAIAAVLGFDAGMLREIRSFVHEHALNAGLDEDQADDLVVAVNEITTNSARHGGGNGVLRIWEHDGALVCEVRDRGVIGDPLVGRYLPSPEAAIGGWGMWIANQVCELVQVRSQPNGTAVRLHMSL